MSHDGTYVEKVRDEMQSYVRTLLADNERVRNLLAALEAENVRLTQEVRLARDEAAVHEAHEIELHRKLQEIREETESFRTQFAELEHHSANLANLYVASYQLNGTLDRDAVLNAIQEIIVNLIGSEHFGVFEYVEDERSLRPVVSIGGASAEAVTSYDGVATVFSTGQTWIAGADLMDGDAVACIPLKLDGRITGLIVIHRLLGHKVALDALDHELFSLLGTHAATALYCTALHQRLQARSAS